MALAIVVAVLAASDVAWVMAGTTYYVALTGNDSNPGTQALPWRTIQKAANTMVGGDTVIVQPGQYDERVHVNRSGSAGLPITYETPGSVSMKGFTIRASYIAVRGFYITGTPNDATDGYGMWVEGSYNTVEDNWMYFNLRGGLIVYADRAAPELASHNVVRNNRMQRNQGLGVDVRGQDNLIEGNEIWQTIQYHPQWPNPPGWVDADGIHFHGGGQVIRKNYIHDISYSQPENINPHIDCFQTFSGTYQEIGHDTLFEQNTCKNLETHAQGENGQGFMIEGGTSNLTIKNNVLQAFKVITCVDNVGLTVLNNTILSSLSFTQYTPESIGLTNCTYTTVQNNIFVDVAAGDLPYVQVKDAASYQGLNVDYNLLWMSDGRVPAGAPYPHDLWRVNPRFVNRPGDDFRLVPGSPAIDAGNVWTQVTDDRIDTLRPQGLAWDMGAYESVLLPNRVYLPVLSR